MRKVIYLFIIVMLLSGCATMNETMESLIGHSPGATTLVVPTEQYVEMIYMPQPRMEGQGLMPYPYYFDGRYFYEQYNRYGHSLRQPQLHLTVPKLPPREHSNGQQPARGT